MRLVLDTNVLVAGVRSPSGASAELLRRAITGRLEIVASASLFVEYEAVLLRPELLEAAKASHEEVTNLLDVLAVHVKPAEIYYLWRPQLPDANDDLVLETAVNARVAAIVTFNTKHIQHGASRFGIETLLPSITLARLGP